MKTTDLISEQEFTQNSTETILDKIVGILKEHGKEYFNQFTTPADIFFQVNPLLENAKIYLYQIDLFLQEFSNAKYHSLQHFIWLAAKPFRNTVLQLLTIDKNFGNRHKKRTNVSINSVNIRYAYEEAYINGHPNAQNCFAHMEYFLLKHLYNYTDDISDNIKQEIEQILGNS